MGNLYLIPDQIIHEVIEDEVIALNMQSGTYFSLRNSAAWIWRFLGQSVSVERIALEIANCYKVDRERVSADVQSFLARLEEEGLIEESTLQGVEEVRIPILTNPEPYAAPEVEVFTDVQDLLTIDPIHDVDEMGWPHPKQPSE